MAVRDIKLWTSTLKNIFSSRDYLALLEVKVLGKVLIYIFVWSVQTISALDSQSKFQMFTLFSARHVGVLRRYSNMAAPYWALSGAYEQEHATSIYFCHGVFIDLFIFKSNVLWMRLPWECHNQSQDTSWRHCVTGPELPFFHKKKKY